jgi:hypothetical protein
MLRTLRSSRDIPEGRSPEEEHVDDMVWAAPSLFLGLLSVITKSWPYGADPSRDEVPNSHADESSPHTIAPVSSDEVPTGPSEPGVGFPEAPGQRAEFDIWLADFFEDAGGADQADTPDGHASG